MRFGRLPDPAVPLLGVVTGILVAGAVTLLQQPTYRADSSIVLVRQGQPPGSDPALAAPAGAAARLFESRAVAASATANLGLAESPDELLERLEVAAEPEGSLVRIRVEARSREEARRTTQEVAEVATVLFNDRFGPQTVASVWEPASADRGRISPKPARNLLLGALGGALAGWALLLVRRPPRAPRRTPPQEPRAAPAGTVPGTVPAATVPVPGPVPAPPRPATGPFALPGAGQWTVADVERLLAEQGPAFPGRAEELELYLEAFRSVAAPDGRLPGDVELVLEDVFAELIARSGSARAG